MSQAEPRQLPPGTLVSERYLIVAPVGQGGLGTVYRVRDVRSPAGSVYALKEQWDQSPSARKQFMREGAWLRALSHQNIPKVLEYFGWNNRLYLVMNFVEGENLEQKLERAAGHALPEPEVLTWTLPICDALHYLHTRTPPLIHRDVKPSNIIVTPTSHPVLVDLGIAKEHAPGANRTATFVRKAGTEGYAPPEQYASAGRTGPWSDVYGMGATLYQLLTAQIPPTAVERIALDQPLHHPHDLNPAVSPTTDAAIVRALAIRPQERFQSMIDFKRALMGGMYGPAMVAPFSPQRMAASFPVAGLRPTSPRIEPPPPAAGRSASLVSDPSARGLPVRTRTTSRRQLSVPGFEEGELSSGSTDVAGGREAPRLALAPNRPAVWAAAVVAAVLVTVAVVVGILHSYTPLDRSTPSATVTGYFAALHDQDYARAWQYTTESNQDTSSEARYAANLTADDARYGRVLSGTIQSIQTDSDGHVTGTISVRRAGTSGAPSSGAPSIETIVLSQYGNLWLIDSISSS